MPWFTPSWARSLAEDYGRAAGQNAAAPRPAPRWLRLCRWIAGSCIVLLAIRNAVIAPPGGFLDGRFRYDTVDAQRLLDALGSQGRQVYGLTAVTVDMLLPVAYAGLLAFHLAVLWGRSDRRRHLGFRSWKPTGARQFSHATLETLLAVITVLAPLLPVLAAVADGVENVLVATLALRRPEGATFAFLAGWASFFTRAKWVLLLASLGLVAGGMALPENRPRYHQLADGARHTMRLLWIVRLVLIVDVLAVIAVLVPQQSMEALRVALEDGWDRPSATFWFVGSALLFAATTTVWTGALLYLLAPAGLARNKGATAAVPHATAMGTAQPGPQPPDASGIPPSRAPQSAAGPSSRTLALHTALGHTTDVAPRKNVSTFVGALLPRLLGGAPLLAATIAVWRASDAASDSLGQLALWTLILALAGYVGYSWWTWGVFWTPMPEATDSRRGRMRNSPAGLPRLVRVISLALAVAYVALFVLSLTPGIVWFSAIGPVGTLLLCAAGWLVVGSLAVYAGERLRMPVVGALVLLALVWGATDWNDNHAVRELPTTEATSLPSLEPAFTEWLANRTDLDYYVKRGQPYPVFVVAAEGGGLRAAYFAAQSLAAIQSRCPSFAEHAFAISGVSGGSLGSAVFASLAERRPARAPTPVCNANANAPVGGQLSAATDSVLRNDFLSPLLAAALYPDLLQRFIPFAIPRTDRALALETSLERAWRLVDTSDAFARPLPALWRDFARGSTPALFLNSTQVESGHQVVVSNLAGFGPRARGLQSFDSVAGRSRTSRLRLSTAVALSARFPLVTPAGFVHTDSTTTRRPWSLSSAADTHSLTVTFKKRFVDGGYYENSGAATAQDIISALPETSMVRRPGNRSAERVVVKWVVLQIISAEPRDYQDRWAGFGELMSPVRTLLNTRSARGRTAVRQLQYTTSLRPDPRVEAYRSVGASEMVTMELASIRRTPSAPATEIPLGWLLSRRSRALLDSVVVSQLSCNVAPMKDPRLSKLHLLRLHLLGVPDPGGPDDFAACIRRPAGATQVSGVSGTPP